MKASDSSLKHNPFGGLKNLIGKTPLSRPATHIKTQPENKAVMDPKNEERIFREAMQDVKPIPDDKHARKHGAAKPPDSIKFDAEPVAMEHLINLVECGAGFVISDTPEYIEGTGSDIHPEFARRLHRGDFSIQTHIDLHGMNVGKAKEAFEEFLKGAVTSGKRAVLIIHGRGLSSPGEPVLKNKVSEWITRGHWRKWVIAYASAQSHDGGTGATYVLLRYRPVSKSVKKRQTKK